MRKKGILLALFVAAFVLSAGLFAVHPVTAASAPLKYKYFAAQSNCTVEFVGGKGWKILASEGVNSYEFSLDKEVIKYYKSLGYNTMTLRFGDSFDGTEHAGRPVNCHAWILPTIAGTSSLRWEYVTSDLGYASYYISGWTNTGAGTYSATIDITDYDYDYDNHDLRFYIEAKDVMGKFAGACYIYDVTFGGLEEDFPELAADAITLEEGAQIRLADPLALGFVAQYKTDAIELLNKSFGKDNVTAGVAILPYDEVVAAGCSFDIADINLYGIVYEDCVATRFLNEDTSAEDGYYRYRGIMHVASGCVSKKYAAIAYLRVVTSAGTVKYYQSDFSLEDNVRSAQQVAIAAYSDVSNESREGYLQLIEYDQEVPENAGKYSPYNQEQREHVAESLDPKTIVKDGASDYKIVISRTASTTELNAAAFFKEKFKEATGAELEYAYDGETAGVKGKYFSIGQNFLLEKAGFATLAEESVEGDGHIIKTAGNSVFLDGIIDRGTFYAVIDYLEEYLGFVFVESTCYSYIPSPNLEFAEIDVAFTPLLDSRSYLYLPVTQWYTDPITALMRKTNNYYLEKMDDYGGKNAVGYVGVDRVHNMQETIIRGVDLYNKKYGTGYAYQDYCIKYTNDFVNYIYMPCLTSGMDGEVGTLDFVYLAMKEVILKEYPNGVKYYSFTQEDSSVDNGYCNCSNCLAEAGYVGRSGLLIKFMNALAERLEQDPEVIAAAPDFKLFSFAYHYTKYVPDTTPERLHCHDRVAMMICLSADNARESLFEEGSLSCELLTSWGAYCDDLLFWGYDGSFANYLEYYPTSSGIIADNVIGLKEVGATNYMVNGLYNAPNIWFVNMHAYAYSELFYDFDRTVYEEEGADTYVDRLFKQFLRTYYGDSWLYLYELKNYYMSIYDTAKITLNNYSFSATLTLSQHEGAIAIIDEAIANQTDEEILKRLYAAKASCMSSLLVHYRHYFGVSTTEAAKQAGYALADSFLDVCNKGGITVWREVGDLRTVEAYVNYFKTSVVG